MTAGYKLGLPYVNGYLVLLVDCDDTDPAINPGAEEVCDGKDNDCDGDIYEGGVCPAVSGTIVPEDKLELLTSWIVAAALIVVASVSLALWNKKRGIRKYSSRS